MEIRNDILAAFDRKPEGGKILEWEEIFKLGLDDDAVDDEVRALEAEGVVEARSETPSESPYYFDWIALPPE